MWSGAGGWEGKLQHLIIVIIYWKKQITNIYA